ncbi:MAG: restriction endonuclease subunit S [Chitinivibrionales bacterium]
MMLRNDKWHKKTFGSFVDNISEHVEPDDTVLDKYIGLEHLDSGQSKIIRWGTPDEVIGVKLEVYKGDIIFGKRRAYQRKAALADFDAICSAHSMVLRANKHNVNISYLLAFIHSDLFMNRAVEISEGSLSPTIKWKTLSKQEFPLPPLEEQKQIAALFQSIETAIEQVEGQEINLLNLKNKLLCELCGETHKFGKALSKNDFEKVIFEKVAICISERVEPQKTDLTTYVGLEHLDPDNLVIARTGVPDDVIGTKLKIYKGDIIFGKRRAYQRKVAVSHFDGIASAHSMILRANEKYIEKDFLPFFMQSDVFMNRAVQISEGSLSPTIKWKTLAAQEFSLPVKEKQKELTEVFKQFDVTRGQLKQQKTTLQNLKQKLLSDILG